MKRTLVDLDQLSYPECLQTIQVWRGKKMRNHSSQRLIHPPALSMAKEKRLTEYLKDLDNLARPS